MRKVLFLGLILILLSTINAFPLVLDNYKLTSVTPKGKIEGERTYEDKIIRIEFDDFTGKHPAFTLRNISNTPLTIIWDLCAFVDSEGRSQRVLTTDVSLQDKGKPIAPTMVIPGAYVNEIMIPTGSIEYNVGWFVSNSIPREADKTLAVVLTVEQQGKQTTYIFTFESIMASGGVLVEGGTFTMGDTWGGGDSDEKPTHKVTFTYNFYIGKYETTFDEYDAFCSATGRSKPRDIGWGRGTLPVIDVSWNDAIAYCNWLSNKEGIPKAYDSKDNLLDKDGKVTTDPSKVIGYRLPTEAEWEYAARGGNKSKGYKYSGSDTVGDVAWYSSNSESKPQEVGKKAPNELGIYDMSGNVWEWCSDWYGGYSSSAQTNPYSTAGSDRVYRGGSSYNNAASARVANRSGPNTPANTRYYRGFRICRTVLNEVENRPPLAPYNPIPSDEAVAESTSVTLVWDSYDPDDDFIAYDVYFGTNSKPTTKIATNQAETSFSVEGLSYDTVYYWKVIAKDSMGATTEGPVWKFTTWDLQTILVLAEKDSFIMGDTWGDGYDDEKPTHKVTFTYNFYIGKYETTFDEYDAFCEATGRSKPDDEGWGRGNRPVINVSWWDAIAYCNWVSEKEKLPKAYDNNGNLLDKNGKVTTDPSKVVGYRLPTEAEWEYAARGGIKSKGYKYSGSDTVGDVAWYDSNSQSKTHEVGTKAPNELGLYDMTGNVWERCSDWYGNYSSSAQTNPYNSTAGSGRVNRGGGWRHNAAGARVAARGCGTPTVTVYHLGFRICRTVP